MPSSVATPWESSGKCGSVMLKAAMSPAVLRPRAVLALAVGGGKATRNSAPTPQFVSNSDPFGLFCAAVKAAWQFLELSLALVACRSNY